MGKKNGTQATVANETEATPEVKAPKVKPEMVLIGGKYRVSRDKVRGYLQQFETNQLSDAHKSMQTWFKNNETEIRLVAAGGGVTAPAATAAV